MEAAVAAVTAEFAAHSLASNAPASSSASVEPQAGRHTNGNSRGGKGSREAGRRGGGAGNKSTRENGRTQSIAASTSDAPIYDLPAPATQFTDGQRRGVTGNVNGDGHTPRQERRGGGRGGGGRRGGKPVAAAGCPPASSGPRYRSKLTTDDTASEADGPSSSIPKEKQKLPTQEELDALSYRERLTLQLNTASIDCPVCINPITRKQSIASCRTCSAPYHLRCLKDWAERSVAQVKEKAALMQQQPGVELRAHWRCPSCQTQYGENETPRNYWCFCGRTKEPHRATGGGGLGNAHSCEKPCRRERPDGCTHPCPLLCHPATCDPCNVMLRMRCHCGKEEKAIRCGTLNPQPGSGASRIDVPAFLSCGQICGRLLPCGLHTCDKTCHAGDCGDCGIVREKVCYCAQESKQELCGGQKQAEARKQCFSPEEDASVHWQGEFSCGRPCPHEYDCGKHTEAVTEPRTCHPHDSANPLACPRSPTVVTTCACGQTPLTSLFRPPRTACTDAIPSCGKICSRVRPSCGHSCTAVCHEGPCPPCREVAKLVCRCGNEKREMACIDLQASGEAELRCERPCRALRACGRHECGRRCCPLAFQEANKKSIRKRPLISNNFGAIDDEDPLGLHVCDRICGKKLNCGNHSCEQPDHRGPCPPCLRSSFEEIACHCGSTVLIPPIPCSTRIVCNQPCDRPDPPCGHQKAPHACHEDDVACPPCPFLTTKPCQCHRHLEVKNVRCSQANVSCGKVCGALLSCGGHHCRKMCHPAGECEDCTQICGKPKKHCGHPCQKKCHAPSSCPTDEPCTELVEATCPCGRIKQRTRCGSCNSRSESNGGVQLQCNPQCAIAQRNAQLAEALGVSKDRVAAQQETAWDPETLHYYSANSTWANGIEQAFLEFIRSSRQTHMFPAMKQPQRKFVHEVAEKFKLRSESLDEEPFRSVLVARKPESAAPQPLLSQAWSAHFNKAHAASSAPKRALVTQSPTPVPTPPKQEVNALYLEACFGYDEQGLKEALAPYMQGIYFSLRWLNDEDVICLPRTAMSPSELTLKLRLIRNNARNKLASCKTVDTAYYDAAAETVTHRERGWGSVAPPLTTSATSAWQGASSASLAAMTPAAGQTWPNSRFHSKAATPTSSRPVTPSREVDVIGQGLNRPPAAVIVPTSSSMNKEASTEEVKENWEDDI